MVSLKTKIQRFLKNSLLLSLEQKNRYLDLLPKLTKHQSEQLKEILELERLMLRELLQEQLHDPKKQKLYQNFQQLFRRGIRKAFKDKEAGQKKEEKAVLESLEKELESF